MYIATRHFLKTQNKLLELRGQHWKKSEIISITFCCINANADIMAEVCM